MTLRKVEYDHFVVEKKQFLGISPYWSISIHPYLQHLFKQQYSPTLTNDGAQPGWMKELKFETSEEAVEFGWTLVPIIDARRAAYEVYNAAYKQMIDAAHRKLMS